MTLRRTATFALALVVLAALFALPTAASAESQNPPTLTPYLSEKQPLWHKGTKVGTGNAYVGYGAKGISVTRVFAAFQAPAAGRTWRARVVASYDCATNTEPANGESFVVTHYTRASPWTSTKLPGMSGTLKAKSLSDTCPGDTALYGDQLVRLQVAPVGGAIYAASTLNSY